MSQERNETNKATEANDINKTQETIETQKMETVVTVDKSKKQKKVIIFFAIAAVLVLAVAIGVIVASSNRGKKLQKQLDLGNKYLEEMDYEQAVSAFKAVLDVDPRNVEAYEGLLDAYIALQDAQGITDTYLQAVQYLPDEQLEYVQKTASDSLETLTQLAIDSKEYDRAESFVNLIKQVDADRVERLSVQIAEMKATEALKTEESKEKQVEQTGNEPEQRASKKIQFSDGVLTYRKELTEHLNDSNTLQYAAGGSVIVYDGKHYGAMDYWGNIMVPYEYDGYVGPSQSGHFVMKKMADYPYTNVLYSTKGEIVYEGSDDVVASQNMYTIARGVPYKEPGWESSIEKTIMEYYDYSGNLISTIEGGVGYTMAGDAGTYAISAYGFYDGETVTIYDSYDNKWSERRQNSNDYTSPSPSNSQIGIVNEKGTVKWKDSMNLIERDADNDLYVIDFIPLNSFNHGYTVCFAEGQPTGDSWYRLIDKNGYVCEFDVTGYSLNEDGNLLYYVKNMGYNQRKMRYYSASDEERYDKAFADGYIQGFFYDGDIYYNYGSKVNLKVGDKNVLIDLGTGTDKLPNKSFDWLGMSDNLYWLVNDKGKWGYCDHEGNIKQMYQDAAEFNDGYALIIDNGIAYVINEDFERVQEIGLADSVCQYGDLYCVVVDGDVYAFSLDE